MADEELRTLERKWEQTGMFEDLAAVIRCASRLQPYENLRGLYLSAVSSEPAQTTQLMVDLGHYHLDTWAKVPKENAALVQLVSDHVVTQGFDIDYGWVRECGILIAYFPVRQQGDELASICHQLDTRAGFFAGFGTQVSLFLDNTAYQAPGSDAKTYRINVSPHKAFLDLRFHRFSAFRDFAHRRLKDRFWRQAEG